MVVGAGRSLSTRVMAPTAVGVLLLTACVPGVEGASATTSAGGPSVPVGSPPEAYAEALADMEPITLNFGGLTTGPGEPNTDAFVDYGALVEEWSGGKISFEFDYAGARVPLDGMADGLSQGRVDMGTYIPSYQPDEWPTSNIVTSMSHFGHNNPVSGSLATFAAQSEFGQTWAPLQEEAGDHAIVAMYPLYSAGFDIKMQCVGDEPRETLEDLRGTQVRVVDQAHLRVAQSLGMTPVSLTTNELFQGLQRGVVDCAVNSVSSHLSAGYYEVTDSWTFGVGQGADWGETPQGWGVSQRRWNELPLAAQQLLWDTQPQMLESVLMASMDTMREAIQVSHDMDMGFGEYDDEVVAAMRESYAETEDLTAQRIEESELAEDGSSVVREYADLHDKWWDIVTEELGYPDDTAWATYDDDFSPGMPEVDLDPYLERFYEEVLVPARPE